MKLTGLAPEAQSRVPDDQPLGKAIRARLERRQGSLWHGNLTQALRQSAAMAAALAHVAAASPKGQAGAHGVQGGRPSIANNGNVIPEYGERSRCGEALATGVGEAPVNQVVRKRCCKQQPRPWSKRGAPLLWQPRVKTLNGDLGSVFKRWYPEIQLEAAIQAA